VDGIVRVPELDSMQRLGRGDPDPAMLTLVAQLRAMHFDVALQCAGGGETTNAFVAALDARITAGQQWPDAPPLDVWMPYQRNQADVQRLMDIMELIGAPPGAPEFGLEVTAADEAELDRTEEVPHSALMARDVIGVSVGAGSGARCWPAERFAEVLDRVLLRRTDVSVVLTGIAQETYLTRNVLLALPETERVVDLAGKLSLGGLLALISRLRLLIANDSAPAHFATALGVPSVVIFGSAHPGQWAPASRVWHRAVADETAPCRRFQPACGCPDDARALCISAVQPSIVVGQVMALLDLLDATPRHAWPPRAHSVCLQR
jgi:ADP-heptose:LPS heptosyltransferase